MRNLYVYLILALALIWGVLATRMVLDYKKDYNDLITSIQDTDVNKDGDPIKIKEVDRIVRKNTVYKIFKTPKIKINDAFGKRQATEDVREDVEKLKEALAIKEKDIKSFKKTTAELLIENQKLKERKDGKFEFKDEYVNLVVDMDNKMLDSLTHNISITSSSYSKKDSWFKSKEDYYVLSVDDPRVNLNVEGFEHKPKALTSSLYTDLKYKNSLELNNMGIISGSINYEWGMDNIMSWYVGGGYEHNSETGSYPFAQVGTKFNILKIKK